MRCRSKSAPGKGASGTGNNVNGGKGIPKERGSGHSEPGFALVEILLVIWVLMVALGSLVAVVTSTQQLSRTNHESALAYAAAQRMAGELQTVAFAEIFARYNTDPDDDPGGLPGSAPGPNFNVRGLAPQTDDADGFVGRIMFPEQATGIGSAVELREDWVDDSLGMPRDLNGDGAVDGANHAGDYIVLPVTLRIEWRGAGTSSVLEQDQLIFP